MFETKNNANPALEGTIAALATEAQYWRNRAEAGEHLEKQIIAIVERWQRDEIYPVDAMREIEGLL